MIRGGRVNFGSAWGILIGVPLLREMAFLQEFIFLTFWNLNLKIRNQRVIFLMSILIITLLYLIEFGGLFIFFVRKIILKFKILFLILEVLWWVCPWGCLFRSNLTRLITLRGNLLRGGMLTHFSIRSLSCERRPKVSIVIICWCFGCYLLMRVTWWQVVRRSDVLIGIHNFRILLHKTLTNLSLYICRGWASFISCV